MSGATITDSANIIVAGDATFDVSGLSSVFTLGSSQTLNNSTSTATLSGNINAGSGTVSLMYASGTPSLTIVNNGTLTLSPALKFDINNTGPALVNGSYLLISTNGTDSSAVAGAVPPSVIITGGGVTAGATTSLSISNAELYLVVSGSVNTNPTNIVFSLAGNQLTLSWAADHIGWTLQAQTNSLSAGISTNWFDVDGAIATNKVIIPINLVNDSVFYRLVYP
jgi:hypothetical protein